MSQIAIGKKFGVLMATWETSFAEYDIPNLGIRRFDEIEYRVVLMIYTRTENGWCDSNSKESTFFYEEVIAID